MPLTGLSKFVVLCQWLIVSLMVVQAAGVARGDDIDGAIRIIQAVQADGAGHAEAVQAARKLRNSGTGALVPILKSLNTANPLAANWLRGVFESIADHKDTVLPVKDFEEFLANKSNNALARRLVYERLLKQDPTLADRLIPTMLKDPGAEFRRDAVARILKSLETSPPADEAEKIRLFRLALTGATDEDQVQEIVKGLAALKQKVDLPLHFGFLTDWMLIGPFDHKDLSGFDVAYPPELELKFDAKYESKYQGETRTLGWQPFVSEEADGHVNLRKALAHHKGAITYAATTFRSGQEQDCQLRLGTPNAWKLWVNGKLLFQRDEYHRGKRMDQYVVPVHLNAGANSIVLKICQNEQTEDWAQDWTFQLRVCDSSGAAILAADRNRQ